MNGEAERPGDSELVTVYRSMDESAEGDCHIIVNLLADRGLAPVMLDDSAPGVPEGAYEVCVPRAFAADAEKVIAEHPLADEVESVDASPDLDMESIYHSEGSNTAEMEATGIKSILEANGIAAMVIGDSVLPNLPFEVRVAREQAARARELVAEALAAGPEAAAEAERMTERSRPPEA